MPEGTELYCMKKYLVDHYEGKIITDFKFIKKIKSKGLCDLVFQQKCPAILKKISQNGKLMWFMCESIDDSKEITNIFFTFGLKGGFGTKEDYVHNRVEFTFDADTPKLFFRDSANFGSVQITNDDKTVKSILKKRGYNLYDDPTNSVTFDIVKKYLTKLRKPIELCEFLLMRQNYLSGLGNVLKCEVLYHAKLSPHRLTNSLSEKEIQELTNAINHVISESVERNGRTYVYSDFYEKKDCTYIDNCVNTYQRTEDRGGNKVCCEETKDKRKTYWVKSLQA